MPAARHLAVLALVLAAPFAWGAGPVRADDPSPPHSLGACGGAMTGADGKPHACAPDRRPACNESGARCVCLEQRACGGARDEPY